MTYKILLIGDSCTDEYHYGVCERLSPEAPVPVLKITRSETKPGMAANVRINLEAFQCRVDFVTSRVTSVKKRYIDERSQQHIVRVDEDNQSPEYDPVPFFYNDVDAIVISDYNKGFISYENVAIIRRDFTGPIFVDSKKRDLASFKGCFVKINQHEFEYATSKHDEIIVTLGDKGALYKNDVFPSTKVDVTDVCGAGDTFLAALVYEYLNTGDMRSAIMFANKASAISVQHNGVYALTEKDIETIRQDK